MSTTNTSQNTKAFRPKLSFFHPNGKGSGCAVEFELHPAHDSTTGSIMLAAANQLSVASAEKGTSFARFDWENKIVVKLDFTDLSKILQVFRGETEMIDDGKGLYHRCRDFTTRIVFRHLIEPVNGYSLEIFRSYGNGTERRSHMLFSPAESLGLCEAISGAMSIVAFGIPMVLRGDKDEQ